MVPTSAIRFPMYSPRREPVKGAWSLLTSITQLRVGSLTSPQVNLNSLCRWLKYSVVRRRVYS